MVLACRVEPSGDVVCADLAGDAWYGVDVQFEQGTRDRTAAGLTGLSRETARYALQRLARDGWIHQTGEAYGSHGASWSILEPGVALGLEIATRLVAATSNPALNQTTPTQTTPTQTAPAATSPQTGSDTLSTGESSLDRSHVVPPPQEGPCTPSPVDHIPAAAPVEARTDFLSRLNQRLQAQAHDVFTGRNPASGHAAGAVWARLH